MMSQHMAADLLRIGRRGWHFMHNRGIVHHNDPIREFQDLV